MSVYQTEDGRWYCQYYKPGARRSSKKYFGRGSKAKLTAEAWDKDYRLKKKAGRIRPDTAPVSGGPTFNEIAVAYLNQKPLSANSKATIAYTLRSTISKLFGHKCVTDLSMKDLTDLDAELVTKDLALSTRNRYRSYCRAILQWAEDGGLIDSNPFSKFKPNRSKEAKAPDLITDEELKAIWANASTHLRWVITCMLNLGVRPGPSELFAIKMKDVDFARDGIWVARTKTRSSKGLVPCHPVFLEKLSVLKIKEPNRIYLIEHPDNPGKPIKTLKTTWWNTLRRAGIYKENGGKRKAPGYLKQRVRGQERRIRLYDLRHKFASMLLSEGADIKATSEIMGHASTSTTMNIYYHLLDGQKKEAINRLQIPKLETSEDEFTDDF